MTELINAQINMFGLSLILGALMGASYDVIRSIRRIVPHNLFFLSMEDFIYWFTWTIKVTDSIFRYNYGELRIYIFIGLILGFCVYKGTIGWVYMKIFNYIWGHIEKYIQNIKKNLKKNSKKGII